MFARQGQKLPYVVQCVTAASSPVTGTPPERLGTILFALSPDGKQAWFAATVLSRGIDRQAVWLTGDDQPLVISEQVRTDF